MGRESMSTHNEAMRGNSGATGMFLRFPRRYHGPKWRMRQPALSASLSPACEPALGACVLWRDLNSWRKRDEIRETWPEPAWLRVWRRAWARPLRAVA